MKNKFYAVVTKCGHVGRNNYREVTFPINAKSGKEAAEIARWLPRVKHHKKDAIVRVFEIDYEKYKELREWIMKIMIIQKKEWHVLSINKRRKE